MCCDAVWFSLSFGTKHSILLSLFSAEAKADNVLFSDVIWFSLFLGTEHFNLFDSAFS
jgi:hypothetical protein